MDGARDRIEWNAMGWGGQAGTGWDRVDFDRLGSVVWCGVVWCDVMWCGVVWYGVVRCGVVWYGVVWCNQSSLNPPTPTCSTYTSVPPLSHLLAAAG